MPITRSDVEKIAELGRLDLTPEETDSFTTQLASILEYVSKLNELDTSAVNPMSHCLTVDPGYAEREDEVRPSLGSSVATENAPDAEAGYFKVPKVIGG